MNTNFKVFGIFKGFRKEKKILSFSVSPFSSDPSELNMIALEGVSSGAERGVRGVTTRGPGQCLFYKITYLLRICVVLSELVP